MQIIYNEQKKVIVCAVARCGTNYLSQIAPLINYKELSNNDITDYSKYTVIKIVRNPFNRFISWWYSFPGNLNKTEDHPKHWTEKQVDQWIENFKINMHYDEHTGFQSMLYYQYNEFSNNNIFVKIEDLDIVLGLSSKQRYPDSYSEHILENTVFINNLFKSVRKLYKRDINWYNQLDTAIPKNLC